MGNRLTGLIGRQVVRLCAVLLMAAPAVALDRVTIAVVGRDRGLERIVANASLVVAAKREGRTGAEDVFAAALADYARLLDALYAEGRYGGVVNIRIDGQEAAEIPLLRTPNRISTVAIRVDPGPAFRFGDARIGPLPPRTALPPGFRPGAPARAPVVRDAVEAGIEAWRGYGFAKAAVSGENVAADHRNATLDTVVALNPGPLVRFGTLVIASPSAVRAEAIRRIAGLPEGERFDPEDVDLVVERLRETSVFASVTVTEAETLGPGNTMDILLETSDRKPRRFGFGAEISSLEGLTVSGFWIHRNAFGGAERLRFDAEASGLGGETGADFLLGARLEVPAPVGPRTRAFTYVTLEHIDEPDYLSDQIELGFGLGRRNRNDTETEVALAYLYSDTSDDLGDRTFSLLTFPATGTYDTRDSTLDATEGFYVNVELTPFVGLNDTASGIRSYADARAYWSLGAEDGVVLAGRLQFGSVAGAGITETHPDFLFYSGGSGTVRGQPYKSLSVDLGGGTMVGGRSFLGVSAEVRTRITDTIGAVVFADAGYIGAESLYDGSGEWQTGAGIGLRYLTGIGPIRLDVAAPVSGSTGEGVQVYLGIGQAF